MLSALTYVLTMFPHIPLLNNGYLHFGGVIVIAAATMFGAKTGASVGIIGCTLADLTFAPVWAPATIIIKFSIGSLVGIAPGRKLTLKIILYTLAGIIHVGGYYMAEGFIMGNFISPLASSVPLTLEYIVSLSLGLIIGYQLKKVFKAKA